MFVVSEIYSRSLEILRPREVTHYPLGGLKHLNSLPAILERYEWREYLS